MSRQVRRVPHNWKHPRKTKGGFIPLFDGDRLERDVINFINSYKDHYQIYGIQEVIEELPDKSRYMPIWEESDKTHYQMYETTSEGTPISPVMDSPETLAQWLVDNKSRMYGNLTATYEDWLAVCKGEPIHSIKLDWI